MGARRTFGIVVVVVAMALIGHDSAAAQSRGLGNINGIVTDQSGAAVPDVTVRALLLSGNAIEGRSDGSGYWMIRGISKGEWRVEFAKPGFAPLLIKVIVQRELAKMDPIKVELKKG